MVMLQETRLRHLALLSSFVQVASQALLSSSSDCTLVCTGLSNCETPTTCIMVREHFGCECNECSLPCDGGRRLFASSNATEGCTCLGTSCELDCEDLTDWTFSGIYDITCSCERCECATKKPTLEACERIKQSIPYDMDAISRSGCTTATGLTSRGCDKMKVLTMLPMSMDCVDVTLAGVVKIEEEIVVSSHGRVTGGHFDAGGFETRIFRIAAGARLDMTNATLQNGVTTRLAGGGCVLVENFGELLAKRVTFVDCFAAETQGGAVGARLFTYVELELCTITGAIARTFGGGVAVAKDATLRIVASQILNCFSLESGGGVIVFERCRATIIGTEVSNCSAVNSGGGIELQGAQTNITNSQIANCASSFGGGVLVGAATTLLLVASHISRCNAYDSGAAFIVFSLANSAAHLELRDTILDRCSSNRASAAVLWQSTAKVVLSGRTLVAECDSRSSAVITSLEGTLVVGSEANLRNCTSGGGASAIHMYGGHLDFAGEISGNIGQEAGGILGTNEARVTILPGARILHNTAFEGGGAVTVSESATLDVSGPGVRIVGNHAFHGGAFHLDAIHTAFVSGPDVIIAENSAWGNGGAFSTKASRLVIQGSVLLIANYCFGNGGAMAVQRGRLFVSSHSYVWTEWALDFTHAPGHIGGSAAVIYDSETRMPYDADGATMTQNAAPGRRVARYSCLNCKTSYSFDGYSYTSAGWNGGFATAKVLNLESSDMRIEVAEGSHATRVAFSCTGGEGVAKFVGNWANGDGGAAWFSDSSSSFIRGVEFTDNGCLARGSSIFVDFLNTLRATNSTFRSNVGEGSVFVSTLAEAELETIVAQANVGGFLVVDTARNVQLKNVDASENTALTGAGVRIMKTIDVSIKASIFSRNAAEGDGGAIAIIDSDVVLSNTEFNTNSAGAFGGAIASLGSSTLQFRQQDCMLVDFVVDFTQTAASCAPTDPGLDTSALGALTCDFYSMACHELNEYGSCDGCGCFGGPSGFVDIIDRGIVVEPSISSSYFAVTPRANAAHVQSFCLSEGYYSAKAIDGLNTAWGYGGSFAVIIKPERGPLAIHQSNLIGYNGSIAPTNFEVRLNGTSCEAHGNSAGRGGGVTFWDVHEPFWDGLVIKGGNVAAYGAAHATPAVTLRLLSMPSIVTSSSHLVDPTLEVAVYDAHDQIVVSTTSSASVRTNASSSDFLVANDVAPFVNGRAAFPSLVIIGSPGASINLEVESPLATLVRGTAIVRVHVDIRRCLQNEIDESSTCVSCPAGSYLVRDEPTEPGDCIDCPRGADCHSAGNMLSTLHTNKGWWRATAMATTIYKCLPAKACPTRASAMSSTNSTSRACRLGHKGARCGACGGGYYYNYHGVCRKCQRSDRVLAVVFYSALGVIVVLLAYLLVFDHIRVWWRLHDSPKATAGRKGVLSLGGPRRGSDNQATYAMPTTSYLIKV